MPTYRVKPGFRHGAGKRLGPGDLVEHTEAEAAGFIDKLELVEPEPDAKPEPEPRPTVSDAGLVVSPAPAQTFDVEGATVDEVLKAVDAGDVSPVWALEQERAGKARISLTRELEQRIHAD